MPTTLADSIMIDVPAEAAWDFLSDPQRAHTVVAPSTVRLLSGSYDTVGSRYLVTTRVTGQTLDATHEIVRFEAPRLIETRISSQGTVSNNLLQVEPVRDDACVVIMQGEIEWGGSFQALVSRVLTAIVGRKTFAQSLERLKRAIEEAVVIAGPDPDYARRTVQAPARVHRGPSCRIRELAPSTIGYQVTVCGATVRLPALTGAWLAVWPVLLFARRAMIVAGVGSAAGRAS